MRMFFSPRFFVPERVREVTKGARVRLTGPLRAREP